MQAINDLSDQTLLGRVADDFSERLARGERPEVEEYAAQFPQIASLIREVFPALPLLAGHQRSQSASADQACPWIGVARQQTLGDFRIIREIGRGGMGVVYEAEQLSIARRVALKILPFAALADDRRLRRFQNEVRAAATLDHAHIVSVYAVGEEQGIHYYAMQLIRGPSLEQVGQRLRQMQRLHRETLDGNSILAAAFALAGQETATPEAMGDANDEAQRTASTIGPLLAPPEDHSAGDVSLVDHRPQGCKNQGLESATAACTSGERKSPGSAISAHTAYYRSVARLGIEVAQALEHAHAHGIIHRDIKPANLLLSESGTLYVTDFGVARVGNEPGLSTSAEIVGTLRYMSPEQALGCGVVDQRTDIYSLGATLYELLTLRPVFDGVDGRELLQQIAHEEPLPPRQVDRWIPRDLETIVCKSLAKKAQDRYACITDLREDLERFLEDRPITARPIGLMTHIIKWACRYPLTVACLVLSLLLLNVLTVVGWWSAVTVRETLEITRDLLYAGDMRLAGQAIDAGNLVRARSLLFRHLPEDRHSDRRSFVWHYLNSQVDHNEQILDTHFCGEATWLDTAPDGRIVASGHASGEIVLWSTDSWRPVVRWQTDLGRITQLGFSPDGSLLAACGEKGIIAVWDVASRRRIAMLQTERSSVDAIVFAPDGQTIAAAAPQEVLIWRWKTDSAPTVLREHLNTVNAVCFSPDGRWLASVEARWLLLWDWEAGNVQYRYYNDDSKFVSVAFTPDGEQIALGTQEGTILFWDRTEKTVVQSIARHTSNVNSLQFSADGQMLLSASKDMTVRLTELRDPAEAVAIYQHLRRVHCARFLPPDGRIISASRDRTLRIWPRAYSLYRQEVLALPKRSSSTLFSQADSLVARADPGLVAIYSLATSRCELLPYKHATPPGAILTRDGGLLISGGKGAASDDQIFRDRGPVVQEGDLEGDGDRDLVASLGLPGRLVWQERQGDGTYAPPRLMEDHQFLSGIQFGRTAAHEPIELWRADFGGTFWFPSAGSPARRRICKLDHVLAGPTALWLEDLDGDGRCETLIATEQDETVAYYHHPAEAGQGARRIISEQLGTVSTMLTADLDRNGLADLIVVSSRLGVCWLPNLGGDGFSAPRVIDRAIRELAALDLRDVDADGRDDLVVATTEQIVWYRREREGLDRQRQGIKSLQGATWCRPLASDIVLWDTTNHCVLHHFSGHADSTLAVALSPSESCLATAGSDDVLRLWELPSGRFLGALPRCRDTIRKIVWSDEHTLIVAAGDGVEVWDLKEKRIRYRWHEHENTVVDVLVSPDGSLVATLSHDYTIRLWSLTTGKEQGILTGHRQRPETGTFTEDGQNLVTAGENGMLHVWDLATGQELLTLSDFSVDQLTDVQFRDSRTLFAVGYHQDEVIMGIWEARPLAERRDAVTGPSR